jgi:hypothetical protein
MGVLSDLARQIPQMAAINLLSLRSNLLDYLIEHEADQRSLTGEQRQAFVAGATYATKRFEKTIINNWEPIQQREVSIGMTTYIVGAKPAPDGGYWSAFRQQNEQDWHTDGQPFDNPERSVNGAIRAAEVADFIRFMVENPLK